MTDLQSLKDRAEALSKSPDHAIEGLRLEIEIARVEALQAQAIETRNLSTAMLTVAQQIEYAGNVLRGKRFI